MRTWYSCLHNVMVICSMYSSTLPFSSYTSAYWFSSNILQISNLYTIANVDLNFKDMIEIVTLFSGASLFLWKSVIWCRCHVACQEYGVALKALNGYLSSGRPARTELFVVCAPLLEIHKYTIFLDFFSWLVLWVRHTCTHTCLTKKANQ